jgi:hypothetical protein
MNKHEYNPSRSSFGFLCLLSFLVLITGLLSTYVHQNHHNVYNMTNTTSVVVLITSSLYIFVTHIQCVRSFVIQFLAPEKERIRAVSTLQYTVRSLLLDSLDFEGQYQPIKLFVSREELWRVFYPLSFGVFFIVMAVPLYDSVNTTSFCIGLLTKGIADEVRRGKLWDRPRGRSIILCVMSIAGFVSCMNTVAIGCIISNISTNQAWYENTQFLNSSTNATSDYMPYSNFTHNLQSFQSQYTTWTLNSYASKTWLTCLLSFLTPFSISNLPSSISLPVILEIMIPSLSYIAMSAICIIYILTQTIPFSLLSISRPQEYLFFIVSPFTVVSILFVVIYYVHRKKSLSLCFCILPLTFTKNCITHTQMIYAFKLDILCIITGVIMIVYVLTSILYDREENTAIRMGWGNREDCESDEDLFDEETHDRPTFSVEDDADVIDYIEPTAKKIQQVEMNPV